MEGLLTEDQLLTFIGLFTAEERAALCRRVHDALHGFRRSRDPGTFFRNLEAVS